MLSSPFINAFDTRRACLFTQHVFKQNTQLQSPVPPFDDIKEFTKHYELRSATDADAYSPLENFDEPTMYESVFKRFGDLKETCMKFDLSIVREGRFFMIINTAKCKLLQGYIFPHTTPFCTFFKGAAEQEETVQCPDATQAETYVKSFFTIEEEDEEKNS